MAKRIKSFQILCDVISPELKEIQIENLKKRIHNQNINWEEIIIAANSFFLVPAVYYGLESRGLVESIDNDIRTYLQDLTSMNRDRNIYLKQQLIEYISALNARGIEPLLFKGSASLLNNTFPDIGIRVMSDLDILIKQDDLTSAFNTLEALDYQTNEELYQEFGELSPMFRKSRFVFSFELHNTLDKTHFLKTLLPEDPWDTAIKQQHDGITYDTLSPEFQLVYHVVHTEIQDGNYNINAVDLRRLHDFAFNLLQLEKIIDWGNMTALVNRFKLDKCFSAYLLLTNKFLNIDLPESFHINKNAYIHYFKVKTCIRWLWFAVVTRAQRDFFHKFSKGKIIAQYSCDANFFAVNICRICRIGSLFVKYIRFENIKKMIRFKMKYY